MNVNFYVCTDDKRKVTKNLTPLNSLTCNIKDKSSLKNPSLILSKKSFNSINNCNYCYISDFGRYYFIENITLLTAERVLIECKCDVLMSFNGGIRSLNGMIDRQENLHNPYIIDNSVPIRSERIVSYHKIGALEGNSILLTVTNK